MPTRRIIGYAIHESLVNTSADAIIRFGSTPHFGSQYRLGEGPSTYPMNYDRRRVLTMTIVCQVDQRV